MKPAAMIAIASAFEAVAAALREEACEQPAQVTRKRLAVVAAEKGIPASTLRELIARKEIPATQVGLKRGVWMVNPNDVEEYFNRKTSRARGSHLREVAAAS